MGIVIVFEFGTGMGSQRKQSATHPIHLVPVGAEDVDAEVRSWHLRINLVVLGIKEGPLGRVEGRWTAITSAMDGATRDRPSDVGLLIAP